ncbi:MAG: universal stress protein [candidate division NC10 bacterium]|nr:universal stress protein [candidate division NC10 bacterium]MBI2113835.1 universal stress protein [candidate division NC10 bacterium]MBI2163081.1 universal stress protein [candidate division NC10 bacterium]MBI2456576.1 universal stress protein [candidate division NC10 bacterium]MBI3084399.1 universal stress protein [candidate division NC10 bacterium]
MYKKILVPLDGSGLAETVLPHAAALARAMGAEVTLVSVVHFLLGASGAKLDAVPEAAAERKAALKAEAMIYLGKIQRDLKGQGVAARCVALEGDVASEIIAHAEQEESDLIAMGTHGRSGIDRFVMGSIAEKVVRGTRKPVLLIRALPATPRPVDWRELSVPPLL